MEFTRMARRVRTARSWSIFWLAAVSLCALRLTVLAAEDNAVTIEDFSDISDWKVTGPGKIRSVSSPEGKMLEWVSNGSGQTVLEKDISAMKEFLADCDAICFDYRFSGANTMNSLTVENIPGFSRARNWYMKFPKNAEGKWRTARFQLALDDDGPDNPKHGRTLIRFTFANIERVLRDNAVFHIRNVRAVKYPVTVDYDLANVHYEANENGGRYCYRLKVHNKSARKQNCRLEFDTRSLHVFQLDMPEARFSLQPGETKTVDVSMKISKQSLQQATPLLTEKVPFRLRVDNLKEPATTVLRGWRELALYGTVPPRDAQTRSPHLKCTPEELKTLKHLVTSDTVYKKALAFILEHADTALEEPLECPSSRGGHNMWYQCPICKTALKPISEGLWPQNSVRFFDLI